MTSKSDHDLLIEMHAMCSGRCTKVDKHDVTLYGNGKSGLVAKVRLLMWLLSLITGVGVVAVGEWLAKIMKG